MVLAAIVWAAVVVTAAVALVELFVLVVGGRRLVAAARQQSTVEDDAAMASPLTPPVTIVMPWYEGETVERLAATESLRYPDVEVIVVCANPAETARLRSSYGLVDIPVVPPEDLPTRVDIVSTSIPADGTGLLVVEVRSPANPADLMNVGAGLARTGLLCVVRPDTILTDDTLLRLARPFRDRPRATLAASAVARPAGCGVIRHDQVVARRWPMGGADRFRFVGELRRAVLRHAANVDNRAITEAGGLLLVRREQLQEAGGFRPRLGGEDDDLRLRTTMLQRESAGRTRRVTPVATPVAWRVSDDDDELLGRRSPGWGWWALGGPIFLGAIAVGGLTGVLGVGLGLFDWPLLGLLAVTGVLLPATVSLAAVAVDDLAFPKQGSQGELLATVGAALAEPFGLGRAAGR